MVGNGQPVSEHLNEDDLEERDDVVDDERRPDAGEPWAKFSTGRDPDEPLDDDSD
jgi:hypothetical protein